MQDRERGGLQPGLMSLAAGFLPASAMELCWLMAWMQFLLLALFKCRAGILFPVLIYAGGAFTVWLCGLRSRRRITVLIMHALLFAGTFFASVHLSLYRINNFPPALSFEGLISMHKGPLEWGLVLVIMICSLVIWQRGKASVARAIDVDNMFNRLDLGLAVFFLLLIIQSMMLVRGGIQPVLPDVSRYFLPFLVFALFSLGVLQSGGNRHRVSGSGVHKLGMVLVFTGVLLLLGLAFVLLFHAQLSSSALFVSNVVSEHGTPVLKRILLAILFFLTGHRKSVAKPAGSGKTAQNDINLQDMGDGSGFPFVEIFMSLAMAVFALLLLFMLFHLFKWLLAYLLQPAQPGPDRNLPRFQGFDVFVRLWNLLLRVVDRLRRGMRRPANGEELFFRLRAWARRSGMRHRPCETPAEFVARLVREFPELAPDLSRLLQWICRDIYADRGMTSEELRQAQEVLGILARPGYWKARMRCWLFGGRVRSRNGG